ncbi:MAG TPA: hypothetical protein PKA61_10195 [Nitrospira sp.]|nr:hypothetical protein [Nitrospira sp.]
MVRKQVYLEAGQDRFLKQRSKKLGVTESDLIRQSIIQLSRQPASGPLDRQAWRAELQFIKRRARAKTGARERRWSRKDLYDDRLGRVSR